MGPKLKTSTAPTSKFPPVKGGKGDKETPKASPSKVSALPAVAGAKEKMKEPKTSQAPAVVEPKVPAVVEPKVPAAVEPLSNELVEQLSALIAHTVASEVVIEQLKDPLGEEPSVIDSSLQVEKEAKIARENGKVVLLYEMYNEEFDIKDGKIAKEYIDEEYCLSDIMPKCAISLSTILEKKDIFEALEKGTTNIFLHAEEGHILGLEVGKSYTVFVEQQEEQLKRDQAVMALRAQSMEGAVDPNAQEPLPKDDGRVGESCSCIYGNPCTDEYGCKDWYNRYAIAMKNGWKGF